MNTEKERFPGKYNNKISPETGQLDIFNQLEQSDETEEAKNKKKLPILSPEERFNDLLKKIDNGDLKKEALLLEEEEKKNKELEQQRLKYKIEKIQKNMYGQWD